MSVEVLCIDGALCRSMNRGDRQNDANWVGMVAVYALDSGVFTCAPESSTGAITHAAGRGGGNTLYARDIIVLDIRGIAQLIGYWLGCSFLGTGKMIVLEV